MRSTGDLERGAADAIRPILERSLKELALGPGKAELLRRQLAEAYMRGRAAGINVFPHQADRALSAEGIAIALTLQHGLGQIPERDEDKEFVTEEPSPDWTDAMKAAHVDVAVAAFIIRLYERHPASPRLQDLARANLSGALDRLQAEAPGVLAVYASEAAAWPEELRKGDAFPDDPPKDQATSPRLHLALLLIAERGVEEIAALGFPHA